MEQKIEIIILTGYLGAGKTTLLNKLVNSFKDKNIGLLVNDFGKVPVDGSLIQSSETDLENNMIYEIGNGSIFCSCLTSSFVFGLKYYMRKNPDILFIETSGMSDPGSMARLLSEYQLRDAFEIRHVLAVTDSTNVSKVRKNFTFVDKQIIASNTVLLNKTDLVDEKQMAELEETITSINPNAKIIKTSYCDFDFSTLESVPFLLDSDAQSCNTSANAPGTMFLEQTEIPQGGFEIFLKDLVNETMRLKGYYRFGDKTLYYSNNNGSLDVSPVEEEKILETGITLIYEKNREQTISSMWKDIRSTV